MIMYMDEINMWIWMADEASTNIYLRSHKIRGRLSWTQSAGNLFEERGVISFTAAVELKKKPRR